MDSSLTRTIGLAAVTTLITVFVARADGSPVDDEAAGRLPGDSVVADSGVTPRWLDDANVLSLVSLMNQRQIAAADIELSSWRSDTVRAVAASLAREHAELQRGIDSLGAAMHLTPVPSALNDEVNRAFQAQLDSIAGEHGGTLDRAYLREQAGSHRLMADYLDQLSGVASRPEVRGWLASASGVVAAQITRLQAQQTAFAVADSVAADSLERRASARNRNKPINR